MAKTEHYTKVDSDAIVHIQGINQSIGILEAERDKDIQRFMRHHDLSYQEFKDVYAALCWHS